MITVFIFFIALLITVPIFFVLLLATGIFTFQQDITVLLKALPIQLYGSINQNGLLAIPLFMLVGEMMNRGGLTAKLMNTAEIMVGNLKGGLAYVNLLTNAMAASILGSAAAQISVMSKLMVPVMTEKGYKKDFSAAVTLSGGLLGPIIPPSMLMIIYGVVAYQPIAVLFMAGIVPGLLIFVAFALVIFITGMISGLPAGTAAKKGNRRKILIEGLLPGSIPLTVIGCILTGVMTPTEAGAIAALIGFLLSKYVYRTVGYSELPDIFAGVALNSALITGLIAAASGFGWALTFEQIPAQLISVMMTVTESPLLFLLLVFFTVVLLGMFLESISVMIVIVPVLLPAIKAFGIDPIHFGVVISLATMVGLITPPVGPGLFIAVAATNLTISQLFRALMPFLIAMIAAMLIITACPSISLWLVK